MASNLNGLLEEMNNLWRNFVNCRAHFPCVPEDAVGETEVATAPYYVKQGFKINFVFSEGLSKESIKKIDEIGHWINQNFVVRLCALLESHHIVSEQISIDQNINGWQGLGIVRRLRNYFAHSSGEYNPDNNKHRKTMRKLGQYLNINVCNSSDFPLAIDIVLEPLFKDCKKYVEGKSRVA